MRGVEEFHPWRGEREVPSVQDRGRRVRRNGDVARVDGGATRMGLGGRDRDRGDRPGVDDLPEQPGIGVRRWFGPDHELGGQS